MVDENWKLQTKNNRTKTTIVQKVGQILGEIGLKVLYIYII